MFQDYCLAHGKPCDSSSLYCSPECRDLDVSVYDNYVPNTFYYDYDLDFELDMDDIASSPTSIFDTFSRHSSVSSVGSSQSSQTWLYDCDFCKLSHHPTVPCLAVKRSEQSLPTYQVEHHHPVHYDVNCNSHELILNNYRKWLVSVSPNA